MCYAIKNYYYICDIQDLSCHTLFNILILIVKCTPYKTWENLPFTQLMTTTSECHLVERRFSYLNQSYDERNRYWLKDLLKKKCREAIVPSVHCWSSCGAAGFARGRGNYSRYEVSKAWRKVAPLLGRFPGSRDGSDVGYKFQNSDG